jgi:cytochrome P450
LAEWVPETSWRHLIDTMKEMIATPDDTIPVLDVDPFAEPFLDDPYDEHERMREAGPFFWLGRYGIYGSARHDECAAVMKDFQTFCSSAGVGIANFNKEEPFRPKSLVLETDPPEHTRARGVIGRALGRKSIAVLYQNFEDYADILLDKLVDQGEIDGMADLAVDYPLKVFPDAVGLAEDGRENLLIYGNMLFNVFGPDNWLRQESVKDAQHVTAWVMEHCNRDAIAPGGFGDFIYQGVEDGDINEQEAGMLVRSLLSAGVDTTISAIGNALLAFAQHPDQWALLHADPSQAKWAFEECLRYESTVQAFYRTTAKPAEVSGVKMPADEKVVLFLGAANRDPRKWENPETFDITRRPEAHLSFGTGIHRCVGKQVAQTEGEIILRKLAERVKALELTGEPKRRLNNTIRVLDSLPLRLVPA